MITMPHPFEIEASVSAETPDELMITWGDTPLGSVASLYLPAVASGDIVTLADKIYGKHRLSVADPHTVQFPCGNVALIPIPKGQGRCTGLLSIDVAQNTKRGGVYTVAVRQLTHVSATVKPPPSPLQVKSPSQSGAAKGVAKGARAARGKGRSSAPPSSSKQTFSWKEVRGAFQYTLNTTTTTLPGTLRYPEERLLAWLKWRIGVTPASSSWFPVLRRYQSLVEHRVRVFGGDPGSIVPSQGGEVPGPGRPQGPGEKHEFNEVTGKVIELHYDRFGDFHGFTVLTEHARRHRFRAAEPEMEELVRRAWIDRTVVSVLVAQDDREWPITVTLHRYQ